MTLAFFPDWMDTTHPDEDQDDLVILREKEGVREAVEHAIRQAALDHLVGLDVIERMGDSPQTSAFIRNRLSTDKRIMSGDLGEILATEYIDQCTKFTVPVKRLRWKDDRNTAMRGNDVIALRRGNRQNTLLKGESKSRASLHDAVVNEAVTGLQKHSGRPNPSSLAFISGRLRELGRDDEAALFERFQSRPPRRQEVEHLIFTFSGNNSTTILRRYRRSTRSGHRRKLVGCIVRDHQAFIRMTFESLHAANT